MPESSADRHRLRGLLRAYKAYPVQRAALAAQINRDFGRVLAVLVIDLSGFTRRTLLQGIVHFLAILERLERLVVPVVKRCGGRLLRVEADNLFAVFPKLVPALSCAEAIHQVIGVANQVVPDLAGLSVTLGIGYGRLLAIGSDDVYGDEMNLACKLGGDLAQPGEILLTARAHEALGELWAS
jgi:adenylate cyclase